MLLGSNGGPSAAGPGGRRLFRLLCAGTGGVGSDLDRIINVKSCEEPFERRAVAWDMRELPVPTDVLVYTEGNGRTRTGNDASTKL